MSLLGSAIAKRLATTGARDQATAAALKAHQAIADKIVPLIDDASFNLIIGLENAGDTRSTSLMAASIAKLAETDARALLSLSDLRAESNLLIGLLSEASVAPKPEHLAPLRDRYTASGTRAAKAVAGLKAFPEASDLKKGLDALLGRRPRRREHLRLAPARARGNRAREPGAAGDPHCCGDADRRGQRSRGARPCGVRFGGRRLRRRGRTGARRARRDRAPQHRARRRRLALCRARRRRAPEAPQRLHAGARRRRSLGRRSP